MIAESVQEALNKQINRELYSAYLYLSMSAYFESTSYRGMAKWMRTQALEEREHAMKIFDHVISRGGKISLMPIEAPRQVWSTPLEVFEEVHKHEQKVTNWIYDLMDLAIREKDHATANMVRWFVDEQVEEEASASDIVDRLKMIGEEKGLLLMLDAQLAERACYCRSSDRPWGRTPAEDSLPALPSPLRLSVRLLIRTASEASFASYPDVFHQLLSHIVLPPFSA